MESIINIRQDKLNDVLKLAIIITLCFIFIVILSSIAVAYDFSGGYSSSKVVGVTDGNILTIGFSTGSYLDIGMDGEETAVTSTTDSDDVGWLLLRNILPLAIAIVIVLFSLRMRDPYAMLIGLLIGLMAFIIVQSFLD